MSTYARLLRYVTPYWKRMVLLLVTITAFAALSGVSLTLIPPFLKILLYDKQPAAVIQVEESVGSSGATGVSDSQGIPLPAGLERVKESAQSHFAEFMYEGDRKSRLIRFCKLLLLLVIIKNLFGYAQTYLTEYLEQKVLYRIRKDVFAHIQNLPLAFFDREKAGHIISRLTNDVNLLRGAIIGVVASIIRNTLMTFIAVMIILLVSWKLTLVSLTVIPINVVLVGLIGRKLKSRLLGAQEGMADMTANLEEAITGVRVVKAFNQGEYEKRRFDRYNLAHLTQYIKMQMWGALSSPTSELLGTFSMVVIMWYGGSVSYTHLTLPTILLV